MVFVIFALPLYEGCAVFTHVEYPDSWPALSRTATSGCNLISGSYRSFGESTADYLCEVSSENERVTSRICPPTFSDALQLRNWRPPSRSETLSVKNERDGLLFEFFEKGILIEARLFRKDNNEVVCKMAKVGLEVDKWKTTDYGEVPEFGIEKEFMLLYRAEDGSLIVQRYLGSFGTVFGVIPAGGRAKSVWYKFSSTEKNLIKTPKN